MRIALSLLSFRPGRIGGAETYVRKLLEHMPRHAGRDELVAVMDHDLASELQTPGFERCVVRAGARRIIAERILEAYSPYRSRAIERTFGGTAVALFPQQSIFPLGVPVPSVVTVHDLQHLVAPDNFGLFDTTFRANVYPPSLRRAARVIAISETTRTDLVARCLVEPARVDVVRHGWESRATIQVRPWSAGAPYVYYPAATHAHKGHEVLLRSAAALRSRGALRHRIVFTGEKTAHWASLSRLADDLGLSTSIIHLGFVSAEQVDAIYRGADAVVFPTRFEGFGIPVLEAASHGKKIVTSRLPIFDELGVPRECQIEFEDPAQLDAALRAPGPTVLTRSPIPWSETAKLTLDVLRRAALNS